VRDVISHSWLWGLASLALILGTPLALTASPPSAHRASTNVARVVTPPFTDVDISNAKPGSEGWVVPRRDGTRAVLTVDHDLQSHIRSLFSRYDVPAGGLVAIDPKTGHVLAYVGYEAGKGDSARVATDPGPPAASVFKIITASALLDAGVKSTTSVCYGGGMRGLVAADLVDSPKRDRWCATMADALGYSINAVFAKLADRHIDAARMTQYVSAFARGLDHRKRRQDAVRSPRGAHRKRYRRNPLRAYPSHFPPGAAETYRADGWRDDDPHGHEGNLEKGVLGSEGAPVPSWD
jgi:membrane peptidoglycan carboxypeptidase